MRRMQADGMENYLRTGDWCARVEPTHLDPVDGVVFSGIGGILETHRELWDSLAPQWLSVSIPELGHTAL